MSNLDALIAGNSYLCRIEGFNSRNLFSSTNIKQVPQMLEVKEHTAYGQKMELVRYNIEEKQMRVVKSIIEEST